MTYLITEPQLQTVVRATNRAQAWEGVIGLFVGLLIGSIMRVVAGHSLWWIAVCAGLLVIILWSRYQASSWLEIKDGTLAKVRDRLNAEIQK